MEYNNLAKLYEELEKTTKRLEKTFVISNFLKETKNEDIQTIVLLLQGRLFPNWDTREIGVASRIVIKAINLATGIKAEQIENEWRKKGDLGIVAEEFVGKKKQRTLFSRELTIKKVFENLRNLAGLEGIGTVDRKINLIAELLTSAEPIEAKLALSMTRKKRELRLKTGENITGMQRLFKERMMLLMIFLLLLSWQEKALRAWRKPAWLSEGLSR